MIRDWAPDRSLEPGKFRELVPACGCSDRTHNGVPLSGPRFPSEARTCGEPLMEIVRQRRMKAATTALEVAQTATTRNTSEVWLCLSMKWPMIGSPRPANR